MGGGTFYLNFLSRGPQLLSLVIANSLRKGNKTHRLKPTSLDALKIMPGAMKALLWRERRTQDRFSSVTPKTDTFCPRTHSKVNHHQGVLIRALWHESQFQLGSFWTKCLANLFFPQNITLMKPKEPTWIVLRNRGILRQLVESVRCSTVQLHTQKYIPTVCGEY